MASQFISKDFYGNLVSSMPRFLPLGHHCMRSICREEFTLINKILNIKPCSFKEAEKMFMTSQNRRLTLMAMFSCITVIKAARCLIFFIWFTLRRLPCGMIWDRCKIFDFSYIFFFISLLGSYSISRYIISLKFY